MMRKQFRLIAMIILFGACSSAGVPAVYLWSITDLNAKPAHPPVACNSLDMLDRFARLYASGTTGDQREEATLLGESSVYASDNPPDPPCQRAGYPAGPVQTPDPVYRVEDIKILSNGVASFKWAARGVPRPSGTYFTFPEYLVSATTDH
jgi:hypothetical protein